MSGDEAESRALRAPQLLDYFTRNDFFLFVQRVFAELKPNDRFVASLAVEAMCAELTTLMDPNRPYPHEDNKVIFNLPPRHLKSLVCSVAYPLFVLGNDPSQTLMSVTYGEELTRDLAELRRKVLRSDFYRRLFPDLKITKDTIFEVSTSRGGYIKGTSISGAVTGRGAHHFIIDDPIKAADVNSKAKRDYVKEWLSSTLAARPDDKLHARVIVVMQRLHVDDPTGVLMRTDQYYRRSFPAIAINNETIRLMYGKTHRRRVGDLLDPVREPQEVLDGIRQSMPEATFSAQYQQEPVPPEGGIFKIKHFQHYDKQPEVRSKDTVVISWDTAFTEHERSDYSVGTVWHIREDRYYLLSRIRGRMGYPALLQAIIDAKSKHRGAHVLVEHAGSGISVRQHLKSKGIHVIGVKVEGDKEVRAHRVTPVLEAGRIFLPQHASWLAEFVNEVAAFRSNTTHDDQVDSMVQAINWWEDRKSKPTGLFGSY